MPIAAVPKYLLSQDLSHASPGMRFGVYLPIWTTRQDQESEVRKRAEARSREGAEVAALMQRSMDTAVAELCQRQRNPLPGLWDKNDFAARNAWNHVKKLSREDHARMTAVVERQSALAQTAPSEGLLRLDALATAPFTTGLGNEHPLENGFAFLNPYGLPYLPGSGVKGVLRQAARELAAGDWGDAHDWSEENRYPLVVGDKPVLDSRNQPVMLSRLDVLFGRETPAGESDHVRGALSFWDVIPQIKGDSLLVEIMTPHQTHYYQNGATPHESGQPNPISFLTVPPKSQFIFHVRCDLALLWRRAPDLARDAHWKTILEAAFAHAFAWLGFGAKTAVGYGAMAEWGGHARDGNQTSQSQGGVASKGSLLQPETQRWKGVTLNYTRGNGELSVTTSSQTARVGNPDAQRLRETLSAEKQRRLENKKELKGCIVDVEKIGNAWKITDITVEWDA